MIDRSAFHSLSYGLYIIGTESESGRAGCVVNTFQQVTSSPFQVSVALNNDNVTTGRVLEAGRFTASCLSEEASMELIGRFGFHTSADTDKFDGVPHETDAAGVPYVTESSCSWFSAHVVNSMNVGTHTIIVGEVDEAGTLDSDAPMTYAYYHMVKGGKTPPKASSFIPGDAESPRRPPTPPMRSRRRLAPMLPARWNAPQHPSKRKRPAKGPLRAARTRVGAARCAATS